MRRNSGVSVDPRVVGQTYRVWVKSVLDGDSLVVDSNDRRLGREAPVRLFGIDAPERGQAHGEEARRALLKLATAKRDGLMLEVVAVDRKWDRVVGLVYYRGGDRSRSINLMMVEEGHARWYREFGGAELGFPEAERSAREGHRGLWRDRRSMAPWLYRVRRREASAMRRRWLFRFWFVVGLALFAAYGYGFWAEDLEIWASGLWDRVLIFGG